MNFNNRTIVVVMMLLIVTGCSSMGQLQIRTPQPLTPEGLPADELGWWQARFHILWGPDETPSWNVDLILAHQIVLPVLQQHQDAIVLWRFHRRAARGTSSGIASVLFSMLPRPPHLIFSTRL
jgi:hypothetical protein